MVWVVGPIPIYDGVGKEIIALYCTYIASEETFFTDAYGGQMFQCKRNSRPTYEVDSIEPTSNYHVNSQFLEWLQFEGWVI